MGAFWNIDPLKYTHLRPPVSKIYWVYITQTLLARLKGQRSKVKVTGGGGILWRPYAQLVESVMRLTMALCELWREIIMGAFWNIDPLKYTHFRPPVSKIYWVPLRRHSFLLLLCFSQVRSMAFMSRRVMFQLPIPWYSSFPFCCVQVQACFGSLSSPCFSYSLYLRSANSPQGRRCSESRQYQRKIISVIS